MPDYLQCYLLEGRIMSYGEIEQELAAVSKLVVEKVLTYTAQTQHSCLIRSHTLNGYPLTRRIYSIRLRSKLTHHA